MVALAKAKLGRVGSDSEVVAAEEMEDFAERYLAAGRPPFDGVFSNFAPLNCVADLEPVARGLSQMLKTGAPAMLVMFGTVCPGEWVVETLRGRPRQAISALQARCCSRKTREA